MHAIYGAHFHFSLLLLLLRQNYVETAKQERLELCSFRGINVIRTRIISARGFIIHLFRCKHRRNLALLSKKIQSACTAHFGAVLIDSSVHFGYLTKVNAHICRDVLNYTGCWLTGETFWLLCSVLNNEGIAAFSSWLHNASFLFSNLWCCSPRREWEYTSIIHYKYPNLYWLYFYELFVEADKWEMILQCLVQTSEIS